MTTLIIIVLENGHVTLYWDRSNITDRTIIANKPDIVVIDRSERRAMIIDIAVPHDENLVKAEKDKQIKYLDLAHEVVDMWDVDAAVIVPIIVSANGLIAKSLDLHLRRLSLGGWVKGLIQKAVLLDTARIVRRFLSMIRNMCILLMYNGTHDAQSDYSLILISNRDEYYDRPTQDMGPWIEDPHVFGGRDLELNDGGTWLGISPPRKKLGVLLNLPGHNKQDAKGRGKIVANYVKSDSRVKAYIQQIKNYTKDCNDFVFVSAEFRSAGPTIYSYSNANDQLTEHKHSYVGFGNSLPETPLKKVEAGRNKLKEICSTFSKVCMQQELVDKLIELLKWNEKHLPDHQLETRQPTMYKEVSSVFVCVPQGRYGTRTHTIVLVTKTGHINIVEITMQAPIDPLNPKWNKTEYQFDMELNA